MVMVMVNVVGYHLGAPSKMTKMDLDQHNPQ